MGEKSVYQPGEKVWVRILGTIFFGLFPLKFFRGKLYFFVRFRTIGLVCLSVNYFWT